MSSLPEDHTATPAELKALAHPLRLRILRLCLHESMTNKQIADRLDLDPASALHHVRKLLSTGFLEAEPARAGNRGALEKPYRSTNKSWLLSIPRPDDRLAAIVAGLDATRDEIINAGPDSLITNTRAGLQLSPTDLDELTERLRALVREYAEQPAAPDGIRVGLITMLHRLA